jgi:hypothetical protein
LVDLHSFIRKDLDNEEHKDEIELISTALSVCAVGIDLDEEADRDINEDLRQARRVVDAILKNPSLYLEAIPDNDE